MSISSNSENVRPERTNQEAIEMLVEAGTALLARLDETLPVADRRPTIAELEKLLADRNTGAVEIKPNGSIHVAPREEIEVFRAAVEALASRDPEAAKLEEMREALTDAKIEMLVERLDTAIHQFDAYGEAPDGDLLREIYAALTGSSK